MPGGRPNPTQKLDQSLVERYKEDPAAFNRATTYNLYIALGLFVFAGILGYASVRLVTLGSGGLALDVMAIFPILLGLADLDEVRWRRALHARKGVPLPPRPPLKVLLKGRAKKAAPPSEAVASTSPKGEKKSVGSS